MRPLIFATGNPNKVREVNELLAATDFEVQSLVQIGHAAELAEDQDTLEGNALQKARFVRDTYGVDCFSEDTGLEVDALDGAPGVHTAYYGGPERSADANMDRLLAKLKDKTERGAQFRTVVALCYDGEEYLFEGICRGTIRQQRSGTAGFGYDPVFQPDGYEHTFAELSSATKNEISHRGRAVRQLVQKLATL